MIKSSKGNVVPIRDDGTLVFDQTGDGGGGGDMYNVHVRIAEISVEVKNLQKDMGEVKGTLKDIKKALTSGFIILATLTLGVATFVLTYCKPNPISAPINIPSSLSVNISKK